VERRCEIYSFEFVAGSNAPQSDAIYIGGNVAVQPTKYLTCCSADTICRGVEFDFDVSKTGVDYDLLQQRDGTKIHFKPLVDALAKIKAQSTGGQYTFNNDGDLYKILTWWAQVFGKNSLPIDTGARGRCVPPVDYCEKPKTLECFANLGLNQWLVLAEYQNLYTNWKWDFLGIGDHPGHYISDCGSDEYCKTSDEMLTKQVCQLGKNARRQANFGEQGFNEQLLLMRREYGPGSSYWFNPVCAGGGACVEGIEELARDCPPHPEPCFCEQARGTGKDLEFAQGREGVKSLPDHKKCLKYLKWPYLDLPDYTDVRCGYTEVIIRECIDKDSDLPFEEKCARIDDYKKAFDVDLCTWHHTAKQFSLRCPFSCGLCDRETKVGSAECGSQILEEDCANQGKHCVWNQDYTPPCYAVELKNSKPIPTKVLHYCRGKETCTRKNYKKDRSDYDNRFEWWADDGCTVSKYRDLDSNLGNKVIDCCGTLPAGIDQSEKLQVPTYEDTDDATGKTDTFYTMNVTLYRSLVPYPCSRDGSDGPQCTQHIRSNLTKAEDDDKLANEFRYT